MSKTEPNFVEAYRRYDVALGARRPSSGLDERVEAALDRSRARPATRILVAAGATAAVVVALVAGRPEPAAPASVEEQFILVTTERRIAAYDMTVEPKRDVELRRTTTGVRFIDGLARLSVGPAKGFVRVDLGVGYADASDAVFWVEVTPAGGFVRVEAGHVAFVADDGTRIALQRGAVRRWGDASERWSPERIEVEVQRVRDLVARGRADEAQRHIEELLEGPVPARTAEVLSFERGTLLMRASAKTGDACRHWRQHAARFGDGRYGDLVRQALERCGSGNSGGSHR